MVVALEEWMLLAIVGISGLAFFFGIAIFFILKNNVPDSFVHWAADRAGKNICRVHFKGRQCRPYIAEVDKSEEGLGSNMWTIPSIGIKFTPGPEDIEFIEGGRIPCVNYFEKMPVAIKTQEAVAYSQLKDWLNKIGLPIDGDERNIMFVLQEMQKGDPEKAIKNARINSTETKNYLRKYLNAIQQKNIYLKKMVIESGVFTYQTAMKALDDAIAHTSAEVSHAKEVIRAAAKREEDNKRKDWVTYAIVGFILCIGAATVIIVTR